ncbi:MAG: DUF5946 family protein [Candidatus Limnocylindria bacterium]
MQVAAVILAAGASTRFGSPKQLVRLGGRTMLEVVGGTAGGAGLDPVIAVVPPGLVVPPQVIPVINDDPSAGLSRSLRMGLAAVPAEVDGAVILLGDEPMLTAVTIRAVVASAIEANAVVAARSGDRIGPPVFLWRSSFGLAEQAAGDDGLRALLRDRRDLATVNVPPSPDVDTPADLDALAPRCPGCGARIPSEPEAPTHAYIGASPGCWARWSELLATTGIGGIGRHANDAYVAQHPGVDGRRERQSVAIHLIALEQWLEQGITDPRLTQLTRAALEGKPDWPWLAPPAAYALTVHDLPMPASAADGRRWVEAVWEAWAPHHDTVRGWSADVLAGRSHR